ncbi:MAG: FHA domain-containing protein [Chloroflexota bacterium]
MDILLLVLRLMVSGLLYAFLGAILLILWRDLRRAPAERQAARPRGHLVLLEASAEEEEEEEEEDGPPPGTTFPLQPVSSIGRSPRNTVVIPDSYASSQHALLTWREGQWWLADQNSRNGTRLNGRPIEDPTLVTNGDIIAIGRTRFKLEVG